MASSPLARAPLTGAERMRRHRANKRQLEIWKREREPTEPVQLPEWPDDPATAVAEWAEATLKVPTGRLAGKPFIIPEWQRRFLRGAFADGITDAALTTARKNGKTGIIAAWLLAHLVGPLPVANWRAIVVSLTGQHAKELTRQVREIADASGIDTTGLTGIRVLATPAPGRIVGPHGMEVQCLAADKASGHAVGCDLAIIDEAGLLDENKRAMWEGVSTSRSGRDGRLVCISVRGSSPMFTDMLERADDPAHYIQRHEPAKGADPMDREAWYAANPGLGSIKSLEYLEVEARKAAGAPMSMRGFRTWELNQPLVPEDEPLVDLSDWERCETEDLPPRGGMCFLGLDLGASLSLSAACAVWETGRAEWWHAASTSPEPLERGRRDGCGTLYVDAVQAGHLQLCGGHAVDWQLFLAGIFESLQGERIIMGADRFRKSEVVDVMARGGWQPVAMEWRGVGAGATADGSHDVRSLQRMVAHGTLRTPRDPIARFAIASSTIRRDPAGNPALEKRHPNRRIDAASACVIACGLSAMAAARKVSAGGPGFRVI